MLSTCVRQSPAADHRNDPWQHTGDSRQCWRNFSTIYIYVYMYAIFFFFIVLAIFGNFFIRAPPRASRPYIGKKKKKRTKIALYGKKISWRARGRTCKMDEKPKNRSFRDLTTRAHDRCSIFFSARRSAQKVLLRTDPRMHKKNGRFRDERRLARERAPYTPF